jgi:hypothetical protein
MPTTAPPEVRRRAARQRHPRRRRDWNSRSRETTTRTRNSRRIIPTSKKETRTILRRIVERRYGPSCFSIDANEGTNMRVPSFNLICNTDYVKLFFLSLNAMIYCSYKNIQT